MASSLTSTQGRSRSERGCPSRATWAATRPTVTKALQGIRPGQDVLQHLREGAGGGQALPDPLFQVGSVGFGARRGQFRLTVATGPGDRRADRSGIRVPQGPDARSLAGHQAEGGLRPAGQLVPEPLGQGPVGVQAHHRTQVVLHVLEVVRPGGQSGGSPGHHPVHLLLGSQAGRPGLMGVVGLGQVLDLLQLRLQVCGLPQQHGVEFLQGGRGAVQQLFAGVHGREPVLVQQCPDLLAHLALLGIHAQLASLDAGDQVADRYLQGPGDPDAPVFGGAGLGGVLPEFGQLGGEGGRQQGEAFAGQGLVGQEEVHDGPGQLRQGILARPHQAGPVHPPQQALLAQAVQGVGGLLADQSRPGFGEVADLLVHVVEDLLLQGRQGRAFGPVAQDDQEAEVGGAQVQGRSALLEGADQTVEVGHAGPGPSSSLGGGPAGWICYVPPGGA